MTDEREEQRKFEQAMRSLSIPNERLRRPIQPWLYSDYDVNIAWEIWKLARKQS